MIFYMMYVSSATQLPDNDALTQLLAKSRENNTRAGITGMLAYSGGNYMQVLEGDEVAVRDLFEKIARDPRHDGVLGLIQGFTEARQFPDWSMAFRDFRGDDAKSLDGYSEFLSASADRAGFASDATRCHKLLLSFKANMR